MKLDLFLPSTYLYKRYATPTNGAVIFVIDANWYTSEHGIHASKVPCKHGFQWHFHSLSHFKLQTLAEVFSQQALTSCSRDVK